MSGAMKRFAAHAIFILLGSIILVAWCFPADVTVSLALWIYFWCVVGNVGVYAFVALLMLAGRWMDETEQS